MSTTDTSGFGKFIPGFDFLQNLSKNAGHMSQMPNLAHWVAPSMNVEELEKRIEELKNVQFWLEQNARALAATIQAMEVQKLTLVTLQGMNFNIADIAAALQPRPAAAAPAAAPATASATTTAAAETAAHEKDDGAPGGGKSGGDAKKTAATEQAKPGLVDPLKLWGSLTQQFQQIAATAVQHAAASHAAQAAKNAASEAAAAAQKAAKPAAKAAVKRPASQKAAAGAATKGAKVAASAAPVAGGTRSAARKSAGK